MSCHHFFIVLRMGLLAVLSTRVVIITWCVLFAAVGSRKLSLLLAIVRYTSTIIVEGMLAVALCANFGLGDVESGGNSVLDCDCLCDGVSIVAELVGDMVFQCDPITKTIAVKDTI